MARRNIRARYAALAAMALAAPVVAAEPPVTPLQHAIGNPGWLRLSGSVRARVESIDGQIRPGFKADEDLFSARTVVLAEVGDGPIRFVAELWDSRSYTITPGSAAGTGEVNVFEPVQAHVAADFGPLLGPASQVGVRAGRMVLNLGSRRLIAADDYRNTTNGYTGLRVDLAQGKDLSATLIYVLPQFRRPAAFDAVRANRFAIDHESFDLQLWGGIGAWHRGGGAVDISFYGLDERDAPGRATRDRHLRTIDLRLASAPAPGRFDQEIEAAYQWGHARGNSLAVAPDTDVSAWFVHADTGYTFAGAWAPRLSAEFDAISGERPGGRITRFDTLFGMRRADFSPGALLSAIGRANMVAPGVRLELVPGKASDAFVSARALWAESATDGFSQTGVRDPTGRAGRFAGYEFDGRVRHWLVPRMLRAEANAVLFLRRGVLRDAPNAPAGPTSFYWSAALTTFF